MTDFSDIYLILKKLAENQAKNEIELSIQRAKTEEAFRNLIAQHAEVEKQFAKTDAQLAKTDEQIAKTDAQLAKTDAQLAKTDAQLAKTDAQLAKTDAQLAKTDARLEKMIEQQKRINKELGGISSNMGSTAEEFFYYALDETKKLGNIQFDDISMNLKGKTKKLQDEFDIVLYNGNSVGIVEIKYKVHPNDLDNLLDKKAEHFRALFPDYKDSRIYLGIGGYAIPEAVAEKAKDFGVAVLRQKGEFIEIEGEKLKAY